MDDPKYMKTSSIEEYVCIFTYEDGKSSEQLEIANPADDSEAEFQPDDEQENVINIDLDGRIVSLTKDETKQYSLCPS